jgi:hypothetical protein
MPIGKSFGKMASVSASTKRRPSASGGIIGDPVENLSSLSCTPLDPIDAELRDAIPGLAGKSELLQCMVRNDLDIQEGDLLVVSSTEYVIRAVEDLYWSPDGNDSMLLVLEEHK